METIDLTTPAGMVAYFRRCIKTGDVKGAMRCFDVNGVYIDSTGITLNGLPQIESAIGQLCTLQPNIQGGKPHVTLLGDLAMWLDKWEMTGITPEGTAINMSGHTTCLMQKDSMGVWKWLVDNPFGAAVLDANA